MQVMLAQDGEGLAAPALRAVGSPGDPRMGSPESLLQSGGERLTGDNSMLERLQQALGPGLRVERELGRGAMGVVFLGRDEALARRVAIKVLRLDLASATAAERFRREARTLARLGHPNIVQIHQAGEADGLRWFVMDYVEGETLAARMERGPLVPAEAVRIAEDLLDALAVAHHAGVIHRDVKPANVFLRAGSALLGDFGVASAATSGDTLTSEGGLVGTPDYMAPEQLAGSPATPAADLFAVGELLFEMLAGRRWPRPLTPVDTDWSGVPPRLVPVLRRALALDPAARWTDARAFREALAGRRGHLRRWAVALAVVALGVVGAEVVVRAECGIPGSLRPDGLLRRRSLCRAEAEYAGARWDAAHAAYQAILSADSSCAICRFRLVDIDRWLGHQRDEAAFDWLAAHRARFPADWRAVLDAELAPPGARLAALELATVEWQDNYLPWYLAGEERFHRGALAGRSRRDARTAFERALSIRAGFVAPLFDLALLYVALGEQASAARALQRLEQLGPLQGVADLERATGAVAYAFRFGGDPMPLVRAAMQDSLSTLAAGPRILPAFGVPAGAIALGRFFEDSGGPALHRSGLIAQLFSHAAHGDLPAMRSAGQRLRRAYPEPGLRLVELELEGVLRLFDPSAPVDLPGLRAELGRLTHPAHQAAVRHRAALLLALLGAGGRLEEGAPAEMHALVAAWRRAVRGDRAGALAATEPFVGQPPEGERLGPFFRGLVYLARGTWAAADGQPEGARLAWRWHEHFDMQGFPIGDPTTSDADWALGPLARWLLTRSVPAAEDDAELCHALAEVGRIWGEGTAPYRQRADSALARHLALGCGAAR